MLVGEIASVSAKILDAAKALTTSVGATILSFSRKRDGVFPGFDVSVDFTRWGSQYTSVESLFTPFQTREWAWIAIIRSRIRQLVSSMDEEQALLSKCPQEPGYTDGLLNSNPTANGTDAEFSLLRSGLYKDEIRRITAACNVRVTGTTPIHGQDDLAGALMNKSPVFCMMRLSDKEWDLMETAFPASTVEGQGVIKDLDSIKNAALNACTLFLEKFECLHRTRAEPFVREAEDTAEREAAGEGSPREDESAPARHKEIKRVARACVILRILDLEEVIGGETLTVPQVQEKPLLLKFLGKYHVIPFTAWNKITSKNGPEVFMQTIQIESSKRVDVIQNLF